MSWLPLAAIGAAAAIGLWLVVKCIRSTISGLLCNLWYEQYALGFYGGGRHTWHALDFSGCILLSVGAGFEDDDSRERCPLVIHTRGLSWKVTDLCDDVLKGLGCTSYPDDQSTRWELTENWDDQLNKGVQYQLICRTCNSRAVGFSFSLWFPSGRVFAPSNCPFSFSLLLEETKPLPLPITKKDLAAILGRPTSVRRQIEFDL